MRLLTLRSVLIATDLDTGSVEALRAAARLAQLAEAELHLLHVGNAATSATAARLEGEFARISPDGPKPASVRVLQGSPAAVIVDQTLHIGADAVVLGPHSRRSGTVGEMGSTAARVVRTAPCPCLVAARELHLPLERVLAAIDVSEAASRTLAVALSWASALRPRGGRARLTALHVAVDLSMGANTVPAIREEVERARLLGGSAANVDLGEAIASGGDPAQAILREAASEPADLLVIGTRGVVNSASGLGSVSATVARDAPCPLLLVPPRVSRMTENEA